MSNLISFLKKLPFDIGQAEKKHNTAGKKIALSFVKKGNGKKALDLGCRDGYWSQTLKKKGYSVTSLDLHPFYKNAIVHDLEKPLPFKDKTFDLIWCTEVIEHLRNPSLLISEINRVSKKGGVTILTTPNSAWWIYPIVRLWGWTPKKLQNTDHKQFFDKKSISELTKNYELFGYFPYAFFFLKIKRFVGLLSPSFILVHTHA